MLHAAYARGGLDRFRQPSVVAYLDEVEALRAAGARVGVAPTPSGRAPRVAGGDRPLRRARGAPAPRPRGRAAARDRGVPRRARLPADRAARTDRLPRTAHDRRARDPRRRRRARLTRRGEGARLRRPAIRNWNEAAY